MNYKEVGRNIYTYRKAKKMTQQQLGDLINRAESSIRKYEKGYIEIPNSVLKKISIALDVPLSSIIDWDEDGIVKVPCSVNKQILELSGSLGYRLVPSTDNAGAILIDETSGASVNISDSEIIKLNNSVASFLKFKIKELLGLHLSPLELMGIVPTEKIQYQRF